MESTYVRGHTFTISLKYCWLILPMLTYSGSDSVRSCGYIFTFKTDYFKTSNNKQMQVI